MKINDYDKEIRELGARLGQNAEDPQALKEMGLIYFKTGNFNEAEEFLFSSYQSDPYDPETAFHLGLTQERLNLTENAFSLYERFIEMPESKFRDLMQGRYYWLLREEARREIQGTINSPIIPPAQPNTVAVYPFNYRGNDNDYDALGWGLSSMITTHLDKLDELVLIERARIQLVKDELNLSEELRDPDAFVSVGRVLKVQNVIFGDYDVVNDQIMLNTYLITTTNNATWDDTQYDSMVREIFQLGSRISIEMAQKMNVALNDFQLIEMEETPTQSLQAFLAYSRGLKAEDEDNFAAAASHFWRSRAIR